MEQHLHSTKVFRREFFRKALHLPAFLLPLVAQFSLPLAIVTLFGFVFFYVFVNYYELKLTPYFPRSIKLLDHLKRGKKIDPAPVYLAFSFCFILFIYPAEKIYYSAYVIAICDSAAALTGMRWGKHRFKYFGKSLQGSLAFIIVCFLGSLFWMSPSQALVAAVILTLLEVILPFGLDNLVLPVVAQILIN